MPKITISVETDGVEEAQKLLASLGKPQTNGHAMPTVEISSIFSQAKVSPRKEVNERAASIITSERGRTILAQFKKMAVCRSSDFIEPFISAGYSGASSSAALSELLAVGAVVRMRRGVYRLPLPQEVATQSA